MSAYNADYERELLRGDQDPRPWDIVEEVMSNLSGNEMLLDVGCGTAFKSIATTPLVKRLYGLEPNEKMLRQAQANIVGHGVRNMILVRGCCEKLPFADASFDVVSCMVAPHSTTEIFRVLRYGGMAIVEKTGDQDKLNIKKEFGSDEQGCRARNSDFEPGGLAQLFYREFTALFSETSVCTGFWDTYYTIEGLTLLLQQAPLVRGFDAQRDRLTLQRIQEQFMTPRGIKTTQNHILIVAKK